MPARESKEIRLGLAEYDSGRSLADARGLFFLEVVRLEPRVLESLEVLGLEIYRQLMRAETTSLNWEQTLILARQIGFADELAGLRKPKSNRKAEVKYPEVYWRDPHPNPKLGKLLHRKRGKISIEDEARQQNLLPSELAEMEQGCQPRAGLTSTHGMEPLRSALLEWGERWHLSDDWCLDWALEQLRNWPPKKDAIYPLDRGVEVIPSGPPTIPAYQPQLQTRKWYLEMASRRIRDYCDRLDRLMKKSKLKPTPAKHSADQHFSWLADYQCCGRSQIRIAQGPRIDRTAVLQAIHRLAKQIGLKLRPGTKYSPGWTIKKNPRHPTPVT